MPIPTFTNLCQTPFALHILPIWSVFVFFAVISPAIADVAEPTGTLSPYTERLLASGVSPQNTIDSLSSILWRYRSERTDSAIWYGNQALLVAEKFSLALEQGQIINRLGVVYRNKGDYYQALQNFYSALEISKSVTDDQNTAYCLNNLGEIYSLQRNWDLAQQYYIEAENSFGRTGDSVGLAYVYVRRAEMHIDMEEFDEAYEQATRAHKMRLQLGDKQQIARAVLILVEIEVKRQNIEEALVLVNANKELFSALNFSSSVILNLLVARLYVLKDVPDSTIVYAERALSDATQAKLFPYVAYALRSLYEAYASRKQYKEAIEYVIQYDSLNTALNAEKDRRTLDVIRAEMRYRREISEEIYKEQQAEADRLSNLLYSIGIGGLFIIIGSLVLYLRSSRRKNLELEISNQKIQQAFEREQQENLRVEKIASLRSVLRGDLSISETASAAANFFVDEELVVGSEVYFFDQFSNFLHLIATSGSVEEHRIGDYAEYLGEGFAGIVALERVVQKEQYQCTSKTTLEEEKFLKVGYPLVHNGILTGTLVLYYVRELTEKEQELFAKLVEATGSSLLFAIGRERIEKLLDEATARNDQIMLQKQDLEIQAREIQLANTKLSMLHTETEQLLLNVMPAPVAERLRNGESPIADFYPSTAVFFSDIVGFTQLSTVLPPEVLVSTLNTIFSAFDALGEEYGLEKIKTIGDAYLTVSGLPKQHKGHIANMADFALGVLGTIADMQRDLEVTLGVNIQVRIGLHTGPVVAGVLGKQKFAYDIWGDTVNTASRMESHGKPGHIHVSEEFKIELEKQAPDTFVFSSHNIIEVKGKGWLKTYFLQGRK